MLSLNLSIAIRSLFSKRSRYSHSAIGWVALVGLILGVAAQVIAFSILSGFEKQFTESILGFNADLVVLREGEIDDPEQVLRKIKTYEKEGVKAITPFLYREGLIAHRSKTKGLVVKGIDTSSFSNVYSLKFKVYDSVKNSALSLLKSQDNSSEIPLILGADLADYLGISASNPYVNLLSPQSELSASSPAKPFKKFKVLGTFSSGLYEFDSQFALASLDHVQEFFNVPGVITGYEMKVQDLPKASEIAKTMSREFPFPFQVLSWDELNSEIFQALKLEKKLFFIIMGLIVLVAAANLLGLVFILISEQSKEISILKAMGMKNKTLKSIFTFQGLILGTLGVILGCALGGVLAELISHYAWIHMTKEVYLISKLPIEMNYKVLCGVATFGLACTYLASWFASRRVLELKLDL